jgi:hypothetical protein
MEKNRKTINISELRKIADSILSHIENELRLKEVALTEDYYWNVADDVLYMGENMEKAISVGCLYADREFLLPLLNDKAQAFPLMLIHLAPILRYLALKVVQ